MSILRLQTILRPPEQPREVPSRDDWEGTEKALNLKLPDDYKAFLETYGSGRIDNFLAVLTVADHAMSHLNILGRLEIEQQSAVVMGEHVENQPYPAIPGVIPCAITDTGDTIYWLVNHDRWRVTLTAGRDPRHQVFDTTLTGFLYSAMTGNLKARWFDLYQHEHTFTPG